MPYPKPVRFFQDRLMDAPEGVYLAGLSAPGYPATLSQLLPDGATRDLRCGAIGQIVPRGNAFHWFTREEGRLRGHLLFPGGHRLDVPEGMACDAAYDPANILLVRLSKAAQTAASELMLMQPGAVDEEGFVWDSTRGTLRPFGSVRGNFTFNMLRLRRDPRTHRTIAYYNHRFERLEVPGGYGADIWPEWPPLRLVCFSGEGRAMLYDLASSQWVLEAKAIEAVPGGAPFVRVTEADGTVRVVNALELCGWARVE